jgi:hypothetical protein
MNTVETLIAVLEVLLIDFKSGKLIPVSIRYDRDLTDFYDHELNTIQSLPTNRFSVTIFFGRGEEKG